MPVVDDDDEHRHRHRLGEHVEELAERLLQHGRTVRASAASSDLRKVAVICPAASRSAHRFQETTTSSAVTGAPSEKRRPSRRVKVQVRWSGVSVQRSGPFAAGFAARRQVRTACVETMKLW